MFTLPAFCTLSPNLHASRFCLHLELDGYRHLIPIPVEIAASYLRPLTTLRMTLVLTVSNLRVAEIAAEHLQRFVKPSPVPIAFVTSPNQEIFGT